MFFFREARKRKEGRLESCEQVLGAWKLERSVAGSFIHAEAESGACEGPDDLGLDSWIRGEKRILFHAAAAAAESRFAPAHPAAFAPGTQAYPTMFIVY